MASETTLYPLRFEPMFQYRIWGGRRLETLLNTPLPGDGPIGEAWILSDRPDHASKVANGALAGKTLTDVIQEYPVELLGAYAGKFDRFPLLLKFLDANQVLSVQVHPSDDQTELLPEGEKGKTEAWVVLETDENGIVYAGLKGDETKESFGQKLQGGNIQDEMASFTPKAGDVVFIPAGTVHTMGGLVAFEVQENSDMTFRLYDWGNIDKITGKPRELHIDKGLESISFPQGPVKPVTPEPTGDGALEKLVDCSHFVLYRNSGSEPFSVGDSSGPRVLIGIKGEGKLNIPGTDNVVKPGEVWMIPASIGKIEYIPTTESEVLEVALPA